MIFVLMVSVLVISAYTANSQVVATETQVSVVDNEPESTVKKNCSHSVEHKCDRSKCSGTAGAHNCNPANCTHQAQRSNCQGHTQTQAPAEGQQEGQTTQRPACCRSGANTPQANPTN